MILGLCLICLPLKHLHINSTYGYRNHPLTRKYTLHAGLDLQAHHDTVFAIMDGVVTSVGYDQALGINIRLSHGEIKSVYGHLSQVFVGQGQTLKAGAPIAITGATGRVTGEHLHFSICYKKHFINPIQFLYKMLIQNENEQELQSTTRAAFRETDRGN